MEINIPNFQTKVKDIFLRSRHLWILLIGLNYVGNAIAAVEPPLHLVIQATENLVTQLKTSEEIIRSSPRLAFELANEEIIPLFDFPTIAKSVLGKHWRKASQEQQRYFTNNFRTFIINLYTAAMVTYSKDIIATADSFKYTIRNWQMTDTTATIIMEFKLKGRAPIKVGYKMHLKENSWKIYDVYVLGMSVVAIYRNNFDSEIKRYGLKGLLERLAAKNKTGTYSIFVNRTNSMNSE